MNEVESVRPTGGRILDLWDDMMKPFEEEQGNGNDGKVNLEEDKRRMMRMTTRMKISYH